MFTKRYAITYTGPVASVSSPRVGGRTFRTRRGAMAQAMRYMHNDTRGGLYTVVRAS